MNRQTLIVVVIGFVLLAVRLHTLNSPGIFQLLNPHAQR